MRMLKSQVRTLVVESTVVGYGGLATRKWGYDSHLIDRSHMPASFSYMHPDSVSALFRSTFVISLD